MFFNENQHTDIKNLKIFEWIEPEIIENIIENCEHRSYEDWSIIIMESEESNGEWYILTSGEVLVSINGDKIAELKKWDIFWEIALLNEEERTASVYAHWDIEVIVLKMENIIEMLSSDNQINKTVISRIEQNLERN